MSVCFSEKERGREGEWKVNIMADREVDFNRSFKEEWERMEDRDSRGGELSLKERQIDL